jgi:hypothetical protein
MKKGLKKFIALSAICVLAVPSMLAHATPPSKTTIHFLSNSHLYEDCVTVSSVTTYAWSDSYADSAVTTVMAHACPSGGNFVGDSGRYWAEALSHDSNYSGLARSTALLPSGGSDGVSQHWKCMPFGDGFSNGRY